MRLEKLFVALLSVITVLLGNRAVVAEEETLPPSIVVDARVLDDAGQVPTQVADEVEPSYLVPQEYEVHPLVHRSRWNVAADAIVWTRFGSPNVPLLRDYSAILRNGANPPTPALADQPAVMLDYTGKLKPSTGPDLLNSRDFEFDYELGPRLSLTCSTDHGFDVELAGFGINHWSTAMSRVSDLDSKDLKSGLQFDAPGFAAAGFKSPMRFDWESRLSSVEANVRWFDRPWLQWLIGFRYLDFEENLQGAFSEAAPGVILPNTLVPNLAPSVFWSSNTTNHLYGGQVGTDMCFWNRGGPMAITGMLKAGLYYNSAEQTSVLPGLGRSVTALGDEVSLVAETGLQSTWRITDWMSLRLGYQLLVLQGVAMAPSQIPVSNVVQGSSEIRAKDTLLLHGMTAGLEVRF
ncbi:MAG: hypothetical protein NTY19_26815 [Planctomycetota bacterium]|nr:hypothetical protein [Planctomycetota bacterium]